MNRDHFQKNNSKNDMKKNNSENEVKDFNFKKIPTQSATCISTKI